MPRRALSFPSFIGWLRSLQSRCSEYIYFSPGSAWERRRTYDISRQLARLDARSRGLLFRQHLLRRKPGTPSAHNTTCLREAHLLVDLIDSIEVLHLLQVDVNFHDVVPGDASSFDDMRQVLDALGLHEQP